LKPKPKPKPKPKLKLNLGAEIEGRADKIETFRRLEGCITELTEVEKEVLLPEEP
jgi:hypothetical protein